LYNSSSFLIEFCLLIKTGSWSLLLLLKIGLLFLWRLKKLELFLKLRKSMVGLISILRTGTEALKIGLIEYIQSKLLNTSANFCSTFKISY